MFSILPKGVRKDFSLKKLKAKQCFFSPDSQRIFGSGCLEISNPDFKFSLGWSQNTTIRKGLKEGSMMPLCMTYRHIRRKLTWFGSHVEAVGSIIIIDRISY